MQTHDEDIILKASQHYFDDLNNFDVSTWLANEKNIALTNESGDAALFQQDIPNVANGHYFFHSRGRSAIASARAFLCEAFTGYDIRVIRGLVSVTNLKTRWITRQIGFKEYGVVATPLGHEVLYILTKPEWLAQQKEA